MSAPRTLPDLLLGALGALMVVAAAVVLLRPGPRDAGPGPAAAAPAIRLLKPAPGAVVDGPLELVFRVEAGELTRSAAGWGTGGLHLHLQLDEGSFMPAADEVQRLPDGSYRWAVGAPAPGDHVVRLYWSDQQHRTVEGGGSPAVRVHRP